jgi:hypothetical protein
MLFTDTPNVIVGRHLLFWRDRLRQEAAMRQPGLSKSIEEKKRPGEWPF